MKKITLVFLICCLFVTAFGEDKVDKKKTSAAVFRLSMLTAVPFIQIGMVRNNPEFKKELYISASIFSIPVLLGWPLFIREMRKTKKSKEQK